MEKLHIKYIISTCGIAMLLCIALGCNISSKKNQNDESLEIEAYEKDTTDFVFIEEVKDTISEIEDKEMMKEMSPKFIPPVIDIDPIEEPYGIGISCQFPPEKEEEDKIYTIVEYMPSFPDGQEAMLQFIANNLKYPALELETAVQGRVVLRFIVTKDGKIDNVEVLKGISRECDREAVRVVKSMPKWIPGKQDGKEVDVYYTIPILFKMKTSVEE